MTAAGATVGTQPLWRDRSFSVFWLSQTLSVAGDSFGIIAVPLLVLHATGSVTQMGLLTGLAGAGMLASGIFAGVLADRLDRRALLIGCDLARMLLYALIPLVWWIAPQVWLLYLVLPVSAAVGMLFRVTYVTAVRNLVDADRLTEANGKLHATYALAGVGGPLLAGVVSGLFGPATAVAVNAAGFAASAVGLFFVRLRSTSPAPAAAVQERPWQQLLDGARFLWRHPVLRALTVLLSLFGFVTLGLTDVLIYYLKHDLGHTDRIVGVVMAVGATGTIIGALVVAAVRRRIGFGAAWIGAHTLCGVAVACVGLARSVPVVAVLLAVYLGCVSIASICSMSLRQEVTPDHLLGRVTSAFWTLHLSLGPVGAALLAWAAGRFGVPAVILVAGSACILIALAALGTPIRLPRPERLTVTT
ncbi:MAG TPA: MFS transporter [Micromonosporaceae bacterium]|nr:MFS transporter [Micromonosporaceae bacterium]